jgi:hypothetical protein
LSLPIPLHVSIVSLLSPLFRAVIPLLLPLLFGRVVE